ncbi:MAG: pentapeptide repeat-containing protein [Candidatus Magasanikbacteria bacterium]|nr:pentapeptide repeat-containing protein [Candidatus Magasanikbacteria bacterium]MBT4071696.1 pentapeptide repeat-containing protein [Candidatus Magasanikbacteria bacterium]
MKILETGAVVASSCGVSTAGNVILSFGSIFFFFSFFCFIIFLSSCFFNGTLFPEITGATFTGADLSGATVVETDLSGATLVEPDLAALISAKVIRTDVPSDFFTSIVGCGDLFAGIYLYIPFKRKSLFIKQNQIFMCIPFYL